MTWPGQLRHLLVKDLTEHRWTVGLYLLAVLVATGHTLGWHPFTAPVLGTTMVFVGLVGGVLVASVVQGDSPTRSDAFWASHPIDASAVLAAKLCLAVVVLVLPIIAQVLALHAYDIAWSQALATSIHDSRMYALIALGAMLVAALTRDLKSFVLTAIGIPIMLLICVAIVSSRRGSWGFTVSAREAAIATLLCAFVEVVLLVWLYHSRDGRWPTRLIGFALVALSFVGLFNASLPASRDDTAAASDLPRVPLRLEWAQQRERKTMSPLAMTLMVGPAQQGLRYAIEAPRAVVTAVNGATATLWMTSAEFNFSEGVVRTPTQISGIRWLNADTTDAARQRGVRLIALDPAPNDDQRRLLGAGVRTVVVTGDIHVSRLTAGPAIDLASGASAVGKGRRVEIESWRHDAVGSTIDVSTRDVGSRLFDVPMFFEAQPDYALVNRARGEGIILRSQGVNYGGEGMIIPGSTMTSRRVHYVLPLDQNGIRIVDDAWLRDAKLQVIDAAPLGSYRVSLPPLTVPPATQ